MQKIDGIYKGKDILSIDQFDNHALHHLFSATADMAKIAKHSQASDILKGNIVTLLFYEPSSRTYGSFSAAVKQLGGQTVDILDPMHFSSVAKGETLSDTIRVFEAYSDAIIIRHPEQGTASDAAEEAQFVPIINAGDGIGEHPTQALLDLYTIYDKFQTLDGLVGVMAGDILNGRTVHSLLRGLTLGKKNTIYLLSPDELKLSRQDLNDFTKRGLTIIEITNDKDLPTNAHFWYWTRVQKERFTDLATYERVKNTFIVTPETLTKYGNDTMILMHPLPRVGEIAPSIDSDPRAVYLKSQVRNGLYVRMALLALILGKL